MQSMIFLLTLIFFVFEYNFYCFYFNLFFDITGHYLVFLEDRFIYGKIYLAYLLWEKLFTDKLA